MNGHALLGLILATPICAYGCGGGTKELPPPDEPQLELTEPEPPTAVHTSGFYVIITPPAEILVDGKSYGTSPVEITGLKAGSHDITIVDAVHGNVTLVKELEEGQSMDVHYALPPRAVEHGEETD